MNIKFLFLSLIFLSFISPNIYSEELKVFGYSPGQQFDVTGLEVKEDCGLEYIDMLNRSNEWCPLWGIATFQNPPIYHLLTKRTFIVP